MKVYYRYSTPEDFITFENIYDSVEEFLISPVGKPFKHLFSEGREVLETKMVLDVLDYPATITIEIIRTSKWIT